MKSIKQVIFVFVFLPFLVIYISFSSFIVYQAHQILLHYTSLTENAVWHSIFLILLPIGISLLVSLIIFSLFFVYLSQRIAVPLKKLSETSNAIATGNLDMRIDIIRSRDEMGMISKSLVLMADQFRTSKLLQERYQDRIDIILKIHYAIFHSDSLNKTFNSVLTAISEYFDLLKATFVFAINESFRIVAVYPAVVQDKETGEFFAHNQVVQLLKDKKHLSMNYGTLKQAHLSFVDDNAKSLCIFSLRTDNTLRGYIIMEGKKPVSLIYNDTTLLFLRDIISYIMNFRVNWESDLIKDTENFSEFVSSFKQEDLIITNTDAFLEKAKGIPNLNVEKGILLIGGEKEKYTKLLQVTIKVISDAITKMRSLYSEDLPALAIEVHGMKSALYTIGAETLGDEAQQIEFAAKSDDTSYCIENYPLFEEKLRTLARNLSSLFPQQERDVYKGNTADLKEILNKAKKACENFDITLANSLLGPLADFIWDNEIIQNNMQGIFSDMENLDYDGMNGKISLLIDTLKDSDS